MDKKYSIYIKDGQYHLYKKSSNSKKCPSEKVFSSIEELDIFLHPNKNQLELFPLEEVMNVR